MSDHLRLVPGEEGPGYVWLVLAWEPDAGRSVDVAICATEAVAHEHEHKWKTAGFDVDVDHVRIRTKCPYYIGT